MTPGQRFLSIREVSTLLGVSRGIVERRKAELGAVEISPRLYRIPVDSLENWLRIHRVRSPKARPSAVNFGSLIDRARRSLR